MKKSYVFLSTFLVIILILSGCEKDYSREAKKFGEDFLKKIYTFEDASKIIDRDSEFIIGQNRADSISPLLSDDENKKSADYIVLLPIQVASANRCNLSVEKLELEQSNNGDDHDLYFFDFKITVKLIPLDTNKKTQTVDLSGNILLLHNNKGFKVKHFTPGSSEEWYKLSIPENMRGKLK